MQASGSRRLLIFATASALFVLSQFYRATIAVITPELTADLGLNAREMSLMSAGLFYAATATEPSGPLRSSLSGGKRSGLKDALTGIVMLFHI